MEKTHNVSDYQKVLKKFNDHNWQARARTLYCYNDKKDYVIKENIEEVLGIKEEDFTLKNFRGVGHKILVDPKHQLHLNRYDCIVHVIAKFDRDFIEEYVLNDHHSIPADNHSVRKWNEDLRREFLVKTNVNGKEFYKLKRFTDDEWQSKRWFREYDVYKSRFIMINPDFPERKIWVQRTSYLMDYQIDGCRYQVDEWERAVSPITNVEVSIGLKRDKENKQSRLKDLENIWTVGYNLNRDILGIKPLTKPEVENLDHIFKRHISLEATSNQITNRNNNIYHKLSEAQDELISSLKIELNERKKPNERRSLYPGRTNTVLSLRQKLFNKESGLFFNNYKEQKMHGVRKRADLILLACSDIGLYPTLQQQLNVNRAQNLL